VNSQPSVLEMAQWYARQGVFVNAIQPGTKELVSSGPVLDSATRDPQRIEELFAAHPDRNLGVVTGPASNLLTLDPDVKKGNKGLLALERMQKQCGTLLPRTLHERTPSKGEHLHYHLDGADVPNGKLVIDDIRGLEVFGRSHNVVVAPSVFEGARYEVIERREIVPLPPVFVEFILAHYEKKRTRDEPVVERNNSMYREACRMRHYNVPEDQAWSKLLALNDTLCTPPLGKDELKKLFKSAWSHQPGYQLTELGNAHRLLDEHGDDLKLVYESECWLYWNGMRWVKDETRRAEWLMTSVMREVHLKALDTPSDDVRKATIRWAMQSESRRVINNSLALAPAAGNLIVKQERLDANPWLFATRNMVIDLRTGKPTQAQRSQLITKCAAVDYDPKAKCPRFLAFLEQIIPSRYVREFLQRYFGYALTGDTREQCMTILHGTGSNGKSTLLNAIKSVSGDYATQAATSTWLQKRDGSIPNDVAALAGARLVVSIEFENNARIAASLLKSAVGQDTLKARFLHAEFFDLVPQFKIAFATNHKPIIDGSDYAMVRRLRLVEFGVQVAEEQRDKTLPDQLLSEASGILNWLIEGCLSWQADGLPIPDEVRKATSEYAHESDDLGQFIDDKCEKRKDYRVSSSVLQRAYTGWCIDSGTRPLTASHLKRALSDRGYKHTKTKTGNQYLGLRLTTKRAKSEY
jgi:putative DNA primase/helicase